MSEADEEFEVERILTDDVVDGVRLYLVKWKGYGDEQCTWEPRESFASEVSLREWEQQKAQGLGLPEEFLANVQQKMDEFQARSEQPASLSDDSDLMELTASDFPFAIDETKQSPAESPTTVLQHMHSDPGGLTHCPASTTRVKQSLGVRTRSPAALPSTTRRGRLPGSTNNTIKSLSRKAGQRFRNLSHMNNYRKKARVELPPTISPSRLRSAAEFPSGQDTAHVLPRDPPGSNARTESPLFIPDTSSANRQRSASPARSEDANFPPARVDHTSSRPVEATALSIQTTSLQRRSVGPVPHVQTAPLPHHSQLVRARNGRSWYRGDIVCHFSMGQYIGDARLIHLPFLPWGNKIVALKIGSNLALDFNSVGLLRFQYEDTYLNTRPRPECVGLVDAFEDQQSAFNEFADYLEKNDMATVFHHPNGDFGLLLYSCDARSWTDIGRQYPRPGSARARLHVAVLPRLTHRNMDQGRSHGQPGPKTVSSAVNMQVPGPTAPGPFPLPAPRRTNSMTDQTQILPRLGRYSHDFVDTSRGPMDMDLDEKDALTSYTDSPMIEAASDLTSPALVTPLSPTRRLTDTDITISTTPSMPYPRSRLMGRHASLGSATNYSVRLSFSAMTTPINSTLKLDKKKARFFIAFSQSHPKESEMVQRWLEKYTDPTNIYLDTERLGWKRFNQVSSHYMSIVLFHKEELGFQKLPEFAQSLHLETFVCFALAFHQGAAPEASHTTMKRMFPRSTIYLITESAVAEHLDAATQVVKYFDDSKKPDYRIMMRPKVIDWFLQSAREESNFGRKDKLIELLFLIRQLNPRPAVPLAEEDDDGTMGGFIEAPIDRDTEYVLSCDSLPGYPPITTIDAPPSRDPRLNRPVLSMVQRDDVLLSYFYAYTASRAYRTRRFIAIMTPEQLMALTEASRKKEQENQLENGHIMTYDIEKFVHKFCGARGREKT